MKKFKFEIYVSHDGYILGHTEDVVKTFKDKDVMKAFDAANAWVFKEYKKENSPDYCIVSQFGVIHL